MAKKDDLKRLALQLTKDDLVKGSEVVSPERVIDILDRLEGFEVDVDLLKETKAAFIVKSLVSVTNTQVASKAKQLLKKWKSATTSSSPSPSKTLNDVSASSSVASPSIAIVSRTASGDGDVNSPRDDGVTLIQALEKFDDYRKNKRRLKFAELLGGAMMTGDQSFVNKSVIADLSRHIEEEVFKLDSNEGDLYKAKVRTLISNIKANEKLRVSIISEELLASTLCTMSSFDLANDDKRKQIEDLHKQIKMDAMEAKGGETPTDMFKCGRCKNKKTTFRQAQTRSADEPMTTFVHCVVCGNRWKF